jgi:Druantia protein DruA
MSCRVAMLRMQEDGLIRLPAPRAANFAYRRERTPATEPEPAITQPVHQLPALQFHQVIERRHSRLWNEYIQRYHYLGYTPLSGAQLRYFVSVDGRFVALLGFGAAAWKIAPRDQFIGWTPEQRGRNMHLVVNNARFLILPWVQCKGLASKLLARIARQLPSDWHHRYGYRPVLLETFVQSDRFRGTCYKAANWVYVGQTTGRGKLSVSTKPTLPIKDIWVYPLSADFRQVLTR